MTAVAAAQAPNSLTWPATSRHSGTSSASWGLKTIKLKAKPAGTVSLRSASHQASATAAATRATGWPTIRPKAVGKSPTNRARCATRTSLAPGATRYHARTAAPHTSRVQTTIAASKGSARKAVPSQANGGGFRYGDQ
ncbi:MAG TPA: hypothetical protein VHQ03_00075 [Candidatus Dormibacteraeota bacterium]|nr:hypothetical protein [Candidatus Dormibacteraeota bacterium]